ncbi:hypothetical protein [Salinicola avicenniae]|uniref:hypothetical protein n=1 Tax=Salinicola avicenniae TaxID=2916836 RepID=UPI002073A7EE|nr:MULTISPECIES: hypothetical protein [unclassified Salinicola]
MIPTLTHGLKPLGKVTLANAARASPTSAESAGAVSPARLQSLMQLAQRLPWRPSSAQAQAGSRRLARHTSAKALDHQARGDSQHLVSMALGLVMQPGLRRELYARRAGRLLEELADHAREGLQARCEEMAAQALREGLGRLPAALDQLEQAHDIDATAGGGSGALRNRILSRFRQAAVEHVAEAVEARLARSGLAEDAVATLEQLTAALAHQGKPVVPGSGASVPAKRGGDGERRVTSADIDEVREGARDRQGWQRHLRDNLAAAAWRQARQTGRVPPLAEMSAVPSAAGPRPERVAANPLQRHQVERVLQLQGESADRLNEALSRYS